MRFGVFGGFPIERQTPKRLHGVFDKSFWARVTSSDDGLPSACGCYVFALRNGDNILPWYVGKTEKTTFEKECFHATKINYYNDLLVNHKGQALLFLIPRRTASGNKYSKPTRGRYRDVDFLESMLIGFAYARNPSLLNMKKTKFWREMVVPGVINTPQGSPSAAVTDLRNALRL
jgi:hypothetical protein